MNDNEEGLFGALTGETVLGCDSAVGYGGSAAALMLDFAGLSDIFLETDKKNASARGDSKGSSTLKKSKKRKLNDFPVLPGDLIISRKRKGPLDVETDKDQLEVLHKNASERFRSYMMFEATNVEQTATHVTVSPCKLAAFPPNILKARKRISRDWGAGVFKRVLTKRKADAISEKTNDLMERNLENRGRILLGLYTPLERAERLERHRMRRKDLLKNLVKLHR